MRIVFNGVHERRKNLPLLLKAVSMARRNNGVDIVVDVIGEGPETSSWKSLCTKLGLDGCVFWHGWVEKSKALDIVATADVFAITSVHDLTSTVLLEALASGKPVVCIDHCGFSDVINDSCGIKIQINDTESMVQSFADAFSRLSVDAAFLNRLSEGAKRRAAEYAWSRKRAVLNEIYRPEWKKILVSAYACSPYRGSEPGMGWNFLRLIADDDAREVWAVVEKDEFENPIREYLASHPTEMRNVHFVFIRRTHLNWLRKIWPPSYYWTYRSWQKAVYRTAQGLHEKICFDCVHQLNMVGFREPGYLWKLPVPFVWGPIGGLGRTDWRLVASLNISGKMEFLARNLINSFQAYFLRRPRAAARKAAETGSLLSATSENMREALRFWNTPSKVLCEIGT